MAGAHSSGPHASENVTNKERSEQSSPGMALFCLLPVGMNDKHQFGSAYNDFKLIAGMLLLLGNAHC